MRRFVDISVPLMAGIASDPPGLPPEIDYYTHEQTAEDVVSFTSPGPPSTICPTGRAWAIERVRMATHSGTHLDAPYHYSPSWTWPSRTAAPGRSRSTRCRWSGACSRP